MNVGQLFVTLGMSISGFLQGIQAGSTSLKKFGREMTTLGQGLVSTVTAPLMGIGRQVLTTAGDFQSGMLRVQAVTQASAADMERLSDLAKTMGADTVFSAGQAAEGMAELAKAGFSVDEIMSSLPGVLNLAAAEQIGLGEAAGIVGGILRGFGMEASASAGVANMLAQASINSNAGITDLGEALRIVGPVAKSAGLTFEETVAVLGTFANANIKGANAGTAFSSAIAGLIKPVGEGKQKLEELGISVLNTDGTMRPFKDLIQEIGEKANGTKDIFAIFGRETGPEMAALLNMGRDAVVDLESKLNPLEDTAKRLGDSQMSGFNGAVEQLSGALDGLLIAIGESGLLGFMTSMARGATEIVNALADLPRPILAFTTGLAAIAAGAGPVLFAIGAIATSLSKGGALYVGFMLVQSGVTAYVIPAFTAIRTAILINLIPAIVRLQTAILTAFALGGGVIVGAVLAAVVLIIANWDKLSKAWDHFVKRLKDDVKTINDNIDTLPQHVRNALNPMQGYFRTVSVGSRAMARDLKNDTREVGEDFARGFATAGLAAVGLANTTRTEVGRIVQELPRLPTAAEEATRKAGEKFRELRSHMADGLSSIIGEINARRAGMEDSFGDMASAFVQRYAGQLTLDDETKVKFGLMEQAALDYKERMREAGRIVGEAVTNGMREGLEDLPSDITTRMDDAAQAVSDAIDGPKFTGVWQNWKDVWGDLKVAVDGVVSSISQDLADALVNGEGSLAGILEETGRRILAAGLAAAIQAIIEKILALIRVALGGDDDNPGLTSHSSQASGGPVPGRGGTADGGGGTGRMRAVGEQIEGLAMSAGGNAIEFGLDQIARRLLAQVGIFGFEEALALMFDPTSDIGQLLGNLWEHIQTQFGGEGNSPFPGLEDILGWIFGGMPGGIGGGPFDWGGPGGIGGGFSPIAAPSMPALAGGGRGLGGGITFINQGNMVDRNEVGQWVRNILLEQGLWTSY